MLVKHCNLDFTTPLLYLSSLTYHMGTWDLTQAESARLDSFHCTQLKHLLGIKWPQRISNKVFYQRCQCEPLSIKITEARWRLFGHVLRMPQNVPAQITNDRLERTTMDYTTNGAQYQPTELYYLQLYSRVDLEHLRQL